MVQWLLGHDRNSQVRTFRKNILIPGEVHVHHLVNQQYITVSREHPVATLMDIQCMLGLAGNDENLTTLLRSFHASAKLRASVTNLFSEGITLS